MNASFIADLRQHELLRRQLQVEFPEIDAETLRDTVEGLTNLPEVLACILRSHLDDLALLAALRTRILDMEEQFRAPPRPRRQEAGARRLSNGACRYQEN